MTPLSIGLIAATAVGVFVAVLALFPQRSARPVDSEVLGRLDSYITRKQDAEEQIIAEGGGAPLQLLVSRFRAKLAARDDRERGTNERRDHLAEQLESADVSMRPAEWTGILYVIGFVIFGILALRINVIVGVIVGIAAPYFGGRFFLHFRQRRRAIKFDKQLSDVIILLSNGLKAGYSFPQSMSSVAEMVKAPASVEFSRVVQELKLGMPLGDAVRRMVERNSSEDLDLMMTAVQIQSVIGGNLAEILDNIATVIRERIRIKGEIRTITAQARLSGWIISLLPIGLAGVLTLVAPDYFARMFGEFLGFVMLGVGLAAMVFGMFVIKKITNIKV